MKLRKLVLISVASCLTLLSCNKGNGGVVGTYTYKLSGWIQTSDTDVNECYEILPEQGQLTIVDNGNGKYRLAFNDLLGGCSLSTATLADGVLNVISDGEKSFYVLDDIGLKIGSAHTTYTAKGKLTDDLLVIENFSLTGEVSLTASSSNLKTIATSAITCIAKKN